MNIHVNILLRIIALFTVAIILSFISDYLHTFFGDFLCTGNIEKNICSYGQSTYFDKHAPTWHWEYRHWLFIMMSLSIAILQLFNIFKLISK